VDWQRFFTSFKMEALDSQILKEIDEILQLANSTLDRNVLRSRILETLFDTLYVESSVFFLPEEKPKSTGGIEINLDKKYVRQYKEHFHLYDPIQLIRGPLCARRVIQLEEIIDYHSFVSSKFYCEFLRPQNIHHKVYMNLHTAGRFHGRIALYRPLKANKFSEEEAKTLKTISPYLAHALDHNDLYINFKLQNNILKFIEQTSSMGLILLSDSMRLIYMNQKAKESWRDLSGNPSIQDIYIHVPPILLEDCYIITEELKTCQAGCLALPKHRVIQISNSEKVYVSSQVLEKGIISENCRFFMISIEEMKESRRIDKISLKTAYHLTNREIDIVSHIFQGLRNAEIAERLFVSEITVKKHIQNIFQKVGVETRTALIHRIVDRGYISSN
jgi:DNA-binding CsgD family transcriptional regulator